MRQAEKAQQLREQGMIAARSGDRLQARTLLAQALELNPKDAEGWRVLAGLYDDEPSQKACLRYAEAALFGQAMLPARSTKDVAGETWWMWVRRFLGRAVLPILLIAVVVYVLGSWFSGGRAGNERKALATCQDALIRAFPEQVGAEGASLEKSHVTFLGNITYRVESSVRFASNSGGDEAVYFTCLTRENRRGHWIIEHLEVEP